ncbi:hypothetical protein QUA41_31330 [Microcoleus sp. Pol11C1]|uniref:hypothetical protein n=1 Tax=unclassified Microcoleus TaxID=2642155 RepID=UPI002FD5C659
MKNLDPEQNREILGQMLGNSLMPVFRERTDADRAVEMTEEHVRLVQQNAITFAWQEGFTKYALGLQKLVAAWKELQ